MQDGEIVCSVLRVVWSCLELSGGVNTEGLVEMFCRADFVGPAYCPINWVRGYEQVSPHSCSLEILEIRNSGVGLN